MVVKRVVPREVERQEIRAWTMSHDLEAGLALWMNKAWALEEKLATKERELRPELLEFAKVMESKLRKHDTDRGESWKDPKWDIMAQLRQEIYEAAAEDSAPEEYADVANFAFFGWWRKTLKQAKRQLGVHR